ncbi:NUDIX domain-containing protein [Kribbella sp. NBC_01484]|uniref:NUDIX hydrolase n=1 Tax=Kribbella sp. NBC_01484 TaxID=2903579 RepID=UPI002E380334|nr:NUDIX domain-containing protein [Kribbella sp. NBC_01484]
MARTDYLDDPDAPVANSLVPSANVVVADDVGRILLIRRTDNGNWALPGGAMDLGETIVQAAEREVLEETGITCRVSGLVGIYTNPRHVLEYTSDGEVRQEFSVVFTAAPVSGELTPSSESSHVEWVDVVDIDQLKMHPSMKQRIDRYMMGDDQPYLGRCRSR